MALIGQIPWQSQQRTHYFLHTYWKLKQTNYVLLAHPSGQPQVLDFGTFHTLMAAKFTQNVSPSVANTIQVLATRGGKFEFIQYSNNPRKYSIEANTCIKEIYDTFLSLTKKEEQILQELISLSNLKPRSKKRSILDLVIGPSNSDIREKGRGE